MQRTRLALGALLSATAAMTACSSVTDDAPSGTGGTAGTGRAPDAGVAPLACDESATSCMNGQWDPIERSEECLVADPPALEDACDGTETLERPLTCTLTGSTKVYRVTSVQVADDCDLGYDLDGCDGNSCLPGEDAAGEGMNGVDNALAGLAKTATDLGRNLGLINQGLYDEFCQDKTIIRFEVDANPEENCATVTTFVDDDLQGTVRLNLSDTGCVSGEIGAIPLELAGARRALENAVGRLTMADSGLANGIVGVTMDRTTALSLATRLLGPFAITLVPRLFDINENLEHDPLVSCNALSVTLRVGGVAETPEELP